MKIIKNIVDFRNKRKKLKGSVGFVPTMGYLHEGHLSLVGASKKKCDRTVVSIFVNPLQFGKNEDLSSYPRNIDHDLKLLESENIDIVFMPDAKEMTEGTEVFVEPGPMGELLCGKYRPGHFSGVLTIVAKLFNIVEPDTAFFGQKDYQQAILLKKMTDELNFPVEIEILSVVREADGLAMSSRNSYLSGRERAAATVLYKALKTAEKAVKNGEKEASKVFKLAKAELGKEPLCNLQYLEIADTDTLQPLAVINKNALIAVAAHFGTTRLIDNILIEP